MENLRAGGQLVISYEDGGIRYFLEGAGALEPWLVLSLLKRHLVKEEGDNMFGTSQSIHAA